MKIKYLVMTEESGRALGALHPVTSDLQLYDAIREQVENAAESAHITYTGAIVAAKLANGPRWIVDHSGDWEYVQKTKTNSLAK